MASISKVGVALDQFGAAITSMANGLKATVTKIIDDVIKPTMGELGCSCPRCGSMVILYRAEYLDYFGVDDRKGILRIRCWRCRKKVINHENLQALIVLMRVAPEQVTDAMAELRRR